MLLRQNHPRTPIMAEETKATRSNTENHGSRRTKQQRPRQKPQQRHQQSPKRKRGRSAQTAKADGESSDVAELQQDGVCTLEQMTNNVNHMLYVSCTLDGSSPVELLVDSGASNSVMSSMLMNRLQLSHKLSSAIAGNAAGVGSTTMIGSIDQVLCSVGDDENIEFRMFFMVLQCTFRFQKHTRKSQCARTGLARGWFCMSIGNRCCERTFSYFANQ